MPNGGDLAIFCLAELKSKGGPHDFEKMKMQCRMKQAAVSYISFERGIRNWPRAVARTLG